MTRGHAIILLILTAMFWSSSGLFIKIIDWGPLSILSGRSIFATFVFLVYLKRPSLKWNAIQVVGAFAYIGAQLFFITATKLTAAANAIFLQYTMPLYVLLLGFWFLKEKPCRADFWSMSVIFIGMLLFLWDGLTFSGLRGNIFGVLSGVSMAVMVICLRKQKEGVPANTILLGNLLGVLIGLPALTQETLSIASLSIIAYLGIFQIGLAFLLYTIAIKYLMALESSIIIFLEPILNPIWVFLVLGEFPGVLATIGALLVIGATTARATISSRILTAQVTSHLSE